MIQTVSNWIVTCHSASCYQCKKNILLLWTQKNTQKSTCSNCISTNIAQFSSTLFSCHMSSSISKGRDKKVGFTRERDEESEWEEGERGYDWERKQKEGMKEWAHTHTHTSLGVEVNNTRWLSGGELIQLQTAWWKYDTLTQKRKAHTQSSFCLRWSDK